MAGEKQEYGTAAEAYRGVLSDLVRCEPAGGTIGGADKVQGETRELIGFSYELTDVRNRIVGSEIQSLRLPVAVARFVWMMSANNRLADIAFYEPKVASFTDDGLTVPGSSYGMRMRQPMPGLDQITSVIERLKQDPGTRRAAVSIYQPVDAVRESKDIPCAFGLMFHARAGKLHTTVLMRSNNAWTLLPFNIFEFTMLAEVVAVEAGLGLGSMTYFAGSMHLFERDHVRVLERLSERASSPAPMDAMPSEPSPLDQLKALGVFEAELRHASAGINHSSVDDWTERLKRDFHPYWAQMGFLLLCAAVSTRDASAWAKVAAHLKPEFRALLPEPSAPAQSRPKFSAIGPLFSEPVDGAEGINVVTLPRTALGRKFREHAEAYELENGSIGASTLLRAQEVIFDRLAARNEDEALTYAAFESAIKAAGG